MSKYRGGVRTFWSEGGVKAMPTASTHRFQQRCSVFAVWRVRSRMSASSCRRDVEIRRRNTTVLVSLEVREIARLMISAV